MFNKRKFTAAGAIVAVAASFTLLSPMSPAYAATDCPATTEIELRDAIDNPACTNIIVNSAGAVTGDKKGILITSDLNGQDKTITATDGQYALMVNLRSGSDPEITISNVTIVGSSTTYSQPPLNLIGNNALQVSNHIDNIVTFDSVTIDAQNNWYAMNVQDTTQIVFVDTTVDANVLVGYDKSDGNTLSFDFSGLDWTTSSPALAFQVDSGLKGSLRLGCASTPESIKGVESAYMTSAAGAPSPGESWSDFVAEDQVQYSCVTVHFNANPPKGATAKGSVDDQLFDAMSSPAYLSGDGFTVKGYYQQGYSDDPKCTAIPDSNPELDFSSEFSQDPSYQATVNYYACWAKVAPKPCTDHCTDTGGSVVSSSALPYALVGILLICAAGVAFVTRRRWVTSR